jgi:hypothetical protein
MEWQRRLEEMSMAIREKEVILHELSSELTELKQNQTIESQSGFDAALSSLDQVRLQGGDDYTSQLEMELESLRRQVRDAWRRWDVEHQLKEELKRSSGREIATLREALGQMGVIDLPVNSTDLVRSPGEEDVEQVEMLVEGLESVWQDCSCGGDYERFNDHLDKFKIEAMARLRELKTGLIVRKEAGDIHEQLSPLGRTPTPLRMESIRLSSSSPIQEPHASPHSVDLLKLLTAVYNTPKSPPLTPSPLRVRKVLFKKKQVVHVFNHPMPYSTLLAALFGAASLLMFGFLVMVALAARSDVGDEYWDDGVYIDHSESWSTWMGEGIAFLSDLMSTPVGDCGRIMADLVFPC